MPEHPLNGLDVSHNDAVTGGPSVFHVLAVAAYRDAGDHEIPAADLLKQLSSRMAIECVHDVAPRLSSVE